MESPPAKRTLTLNQTSSQIPSPTTSEDGTELISMLPDELVVRMFGFVDVYSKLKLERVNRRFKRCVDTPEAWGAAIHVCSTTDPTTGKESFLINGTQVQLSKRTPTLMYLLERITPQLLVLITSESDTAWTLLSALATARIIYPQDRIRLSRFRFDCPEDAITPVTCLISRFNETLQSVDVNFRPIPHFRSCWKRNNLAEFWSALGSCLRLSSLTFSAGTDEQSDPDDIVNAILNKPLQSMSFIGVQVLTNEHLIRMCNNVAGRSLEHLRLEGCNNITMTIWTPWQLDQRCRAVLKELRFDIEITREFLLQFGDYFPNIDRCSFGRPLLSLTEDTAQRPSAVHTVKHLLLAFEHKSFQADLHVDKPGELLLQMVGPSGDRVQPSDLCDWVSFSENRCRLGRGKAQVDLHWS